MINRAELKEKLPRGYQKIVAQKAEVSQPAVCKYLKGESNSEKIEMALLETLAEIGQRKKELLAKIL